MREIYADFNNFDANGNLPLNCVGSVASIATLTEALRDGEEVWLSDGELGAKARIFLCKDGVWEARADEWRFVGADRSSGQQS